jgi:hypothetical protein
MSIAGYFEKQRRELKIPKLEKLGIKTVPPVEEQPKLEETLRAVLGKMVEKKGRAVIAFSGSRDLEPTLRAPCEEDAERGG